MSSLKSEGGGAPAPGAPLLPTPLFFQVDSKAPLEVSVESGDIGNSLLVKKEPKIIHDKEETRGSKAYVMITCIDNFYSIW